MNHVISGIERGASRARLLGWLPHILAIGGLVLGFFDSRFLFLAAAGFFGPGILSELGWLRLEEFQRETRLRAAHQAFLVAGVLLVLITGFEGCGQRYNAEMHEIDDAVPASFVATVLLAVYYLSGLVRYWGARAAAFRILLFYGLGFAGFFAASLILAGDLLGDFPWGDVLQVAAFTGAFVGAAFLGRSRPRLAGLLVLAASVWMIIATGTYRFFGNQGLPWEVTFEVVIYALLLPVTALAALFFGRPEPE